MLELPPQKEILIILIIHEQMKVAARHPKIIWLSIIVLLWQAGCASGPVRYLLPPPPSEEVRAQLGTIGVVSAHFIPKAEFQMPASGGKAGAGRGAALGAKYTILGGLAIASGSGGAGGGIGELAVIVAAIALAPVGALVGAVGGSGLAEPAEKVEEAEGVLKNTLTNLKIQNAMRDYVFEVAQDQTEHTFILLMENGPSTRDEKLSYRSAGSEGIDTVLEISVQAVDLDGAWRVNPPLALIMTVHTRLIRIADDTAIYDSTLEYRSGMRTFTEWAADDAQPLRDELDRAYQILDKKIVDELFLLHLPLESRADGLP